jgi:hypothetical protein
MYIIEINKDDQTQFYLKKNGCNLNLVKKIKHATLFSHLESASYQSVRLSSQEKLDQQAIKIKKINLSTLELSSL